LLHNGCTPNSMVYLTSNFDLMGLNCGKFCRFNKITKICNFFSVSLAKILGKFFSVQKKQNFHFIISPLQSTGLKFMLQLVYNIPTPISFKESIWPRTMPTLSIWTILTYYLSKKIYKFVNICITKWCFFLIRFIVDDIITLDYLYYISIINPNRLWRQIQNYSIKFV